MTRGFQIVEARPEDAGHMLRIQLIAVRAVPEGFYDASTLEAWAGSITAHHAERLAERIRLGIEKALLAVSQDGSVIGFGSIVPASSRLRTLYIDPDAKGQGAGTAILKALIESAKAHGLTQLALESSLNAIAFYGHHGFSVECEADYVLPSGMSMRCVHMRKVIAV
jgi:GNAT superfamily N-acetyltransferase